MVSSYRLCIVDDVAVPAFSAVSAPVVAATTGDFMQGIAEPNRQTFLQSRLTFPNCLLELTKESSPMCVTTFTRETRFFIEGTENTCSIETVQSGMKDVHNVCPIAETSSQHSDSSSGSFANPVSSDFVATLS